MPPPQNSRFLEIMNIHCGSKFWRRFWVCYQTWPSSMISPTYERSKLRSKMTKKAVLCLKEGLDDPFLLLYFRGTRSVLCVARFHIRKKLSNSTSWLSHDLELGCHGSARTKFSTKNTLFDCDVDDFPRGFHLRVDFWKIFSVELLFFQTFPRRKTKKSRIPIPLEKSVSLPSRISFSVENFVGAFAFASFEVCHASTRYKLLCH